MLSDDIETAQTIAYMEELACFDAGERHVIAAAQRALAEAGCDASSAPIDVAKAVFWWLKRNIRYVPTPATSELVDQTLVAPSALVQMKDPEGDCGQYSMLAAAMFRICCIPCRFVTIAADPRYPDIFSHVYNTVEVEPGTWMPFDSSNGPEPGAEYAVALKKKIWPRTIPDQCKLRPRSKGNNVVMLRSTNRKARGWRNAGLRGTMGDNGDYGGETDNPASPIMVGPSVSLNNPALQIDSSSGAGAGVPWSSLITTLANDATSIFRTATAPKPYYVTNAQGQQVLYNPATGSTVTASGSISSSPMLWIGLAILGGLALSRR